MSKMTAYRADLLQRYWSYQESKFANEGALFDSRYAKPSSPPVFRRQYARRNVIVNPAASEEEKIKLFDLVPKGEFHKWYSSMNSSQALAQSVLGNLSVYHYLHRLSELRDDEGMPLFGEGRVESDNFKMEHKIGYLGEPRPTSLDGFLPGNYQIAIECKFTEAEIGACSRPGLKPGASNYEKDYCSGVYTVQGKRTARCSLTESGIKYWDYVPSLFKWKSDGDLNPCPLNRNYQLVRNILAAGVKPDGKGSVDHGHVILIYDARNPAFQEGGAGLKAYNEVKAALRKQTILRKCSWQRIVQYLRDHGILPWLTDELALKYGFYGSKTLQDSIAKILEGSPNGSKGSY